MRLRELNSNEPAGIKHSNHHYAWPSLWVPEMTPPPTQPSLTALQQQIHHPRPDGMNLNTQGDEQSFSDPSEAGHWRMVSSGESRETQESSAMTTESTKEIVGTTTQLLGWKDGGKLL